MNAPSLALRQLDTRAAGYAAALTLLLDRAQEMDAQVEGRVRDILQGVETNDKTIGSMWVPELQEPIQMMWVLVEAKGTGGVGASALRAVVRGMDPDIAVYEVRTMREQLRFALWVRRLFASLVIDVARRRVRDLEGAQQR